MMILKDQKTRRTPRRMRPTDDGNGIIWDITGSEILTYEVALDMHAIGQLALKAGGNKNGRAKSGPVIVVITKREPVPQTPFRGEAPCVHCGKPMKQHGPFARCSGGETQYDPEALYNEGRRILAGLDEGKEPKQ